MRSLAGVPRDASASRSERLQSYGREKRLSRSGEFRRVYSSGRKLRLGSATLFVSANTAGHPRLGVTVTRKVGGAVERNRLKRRVREMFRKNFAAIPGHWDIVVNVRPGAGELSHAEMEREIMGALRRLAAGGRD